MDRFVFILSLVFAFPDTNKEIRTKLQQQKNHSRRETILDTI